MISRFISLLRQPQRIGIVCMPFRASLGFYTTVGRPELATMFTYINNMVGADRDIFNKREPVRKHFTLYRAGRNNPYYPPYVLALIIKSKNKSATITQFKNYSLKAVVNTAGFKMFYKIKS